MNEMKNYETEMLDERAYFESFGMLVLEDDED